MIDSTSSGRSLTGLKKRVVIIWLVFQFSLNKMWKILKYYKKLSMSSFDLAVIRCLNRPTVVENHRWVGHPFAFVQFEWLQRLSFFCKSLSRPKRMLLIVTCQQDSEQGLYLKKEKICSVMFNQQNQYIGREGSYLHAILTVLNL